MSYDVTLFIPAGDAPLEEQARESRAFEENDDDRARLAAMRSAVLERDPAAELDETNDNEIIVVGGGRAPYMEIGSRGARIVMSMGADSHVVYGVLHEWIPVFARHGYVAFDHQHDGIVKPAGDFRAFMQQFRDQWGSDAAFEAWLSSDRDEPDPPQQAVQAAPVAKKDSSATALAIIFGVLALFGALYKLHKAGYF